jgi:hypothetical protein
MPSASEDGAKRGEAAFGTGETDRVTGCGGCAIGGFGGGTLAHPPSNIAAAHAATHRFT